MPNKRKKKPVADGVRQRRKLLDDQDRKLAAGSQNDWHIAKDGTRKQGVGSAKPAPDPSLVATVAFR